MNRAMNKMAYAFGEVLMPVLKSTIKAFESFGETLLQTDVEEE
jgi:hypothetical protein